MTILIDTGSTHNFLDPKVSKKAQLPLDQIDRVNVRVASGEMITSEARCIGVKLKIQGIIFIVDLRILVLARFDIVLGIQWLRYLGFILWNFEELSMKFNYSGKAVEIRGLVAAQLIEEKFSKQVSWYGKKKESFYKC